MSDSISRQRQLLPLPSLTRDEHPDAIVRAAARRASATVVLATGGPGSGRSTWARQLAAAAELASTVSALRWRTFAVRITAPGGIAELAAALRCTVDLADDPAEQLRAHLAQGLSAQRRLALIIDDAHLLQPSARTVLRTVLDRLRPTLPLVALTGDEQLTEPPAWACMTVRLQPLHAAQVRTYVSQAHGIEISQRLAERIREQCLGVPSRLEQLLGTFQPVWEARLATPPGERARFDEDFRFPPSTAAAPPREVRMAQLRSLVDTAVRERDTELAFSHMQRSIAALDRLDPPMADALIAELYAVATATAALPRMFELIDRLTAAVSEPLRDLALLHVREFHGDYAWSRQFADELLERLPALPNSEPDAAQLTPALLERLIVRMQVHMVLGIMWPQAYPGEYGLDQLADARACARWLIASAALEQHALAWADLDVRMRWLPSAHDVLLRATGMSLFGATALGLADLAQQEIRTLSEAIATAPAPTPTLFDAHVIRAGVFSALGFIADAAADLRASMRMLEAGTVGWGSGMARAMHIYCQHLLGDTAAVTAAIETGTAAILDDMDAVGRPPFYAIRAVVAADRGDAAEWDRSMRALTQTDATSYDDTVRGEYEAWAHIARARLDHYPDAVLAVFSPEGPLHGRVVRSRNLHAFRIDALTALGRAEEADRAVAELQALPLPGFQPVHGSMTWLRGRVEEAYGHDREAIHRYRTAAADTAALPAVTARAAFDAGRLMLARRTDPRAARRLLRQAQRTFLRIGYRPDAAAATALLDGSATADASGAETAAVAGLDQLTPRERSIAALAAGGRTNVQIAEQLSVSRSTVAFHLSNVLAKLGMQSRRELRGVIDDELTGADTVPDGWAQLTPRQREVARLAARELTNSEIADELGLSASAVAFHMGNVLARLGLRSRHELRQH